MRVLLAANASYAPPRGGATRSNLLWLDALARAGHECRVVAGASGEGARLAAHESIEIFAKGDPAKRLECLREQMDRWQPDWALISSEDLSHSLLREAARRMPGRIVYLAHTPQFFPFGAESWNPDQEAARIVAEAAGVVVIGPRMADYVEHSIWKRPAVIHPPIYGAGPWPRYENFGRGRVVMINPCAVKGIDIFLETARRMPGAEFGAVPGWGTTLEDQRRLAELRNVAIVPSAESIDGILRETSVLLMPSLWFEGFGLIVMEAMLRGIPVVASDSGGLTDAKSGTGYVITTPPITKYLEEFDDQAMPKPELPEIDVGPWVEAVRELVTDRAAYERESERSHERAREFVAQLDAGEFERYLAALHPTKTAAKARAAIEALSPERRSALLAMVKKVKR